MTGRRCVSCGASYYRSNRTRLWVKRNPGKRAGWLKVEGPVCLDCMKQGTSQRIALLIGLKIRERP